MFFVSVAKCECVSVCVGGRGHKEAKCIFSATEELAEMEDKVFKIIRVCFRRDVEGEAQWPPRCPVQYLRSFLRHAFQHSD